MEQKIKKIVWEARLPILIVIFAEYLQDSDLSDNYIFYLIAFAVFVGLLDAIRKKIFPTMNEESGCFIMFLLIVSAIIIAIFSGI
ncbi:MAG: hypothetical protein DBW97_03645 [SAR86 cluster bacterium]|uniref:Uncharacterized protein n=1 Tax=SAR86 cluster bacterium TaxID=2030880 RepID=A0A368BML6_9GAMM|nr:MAG: hypothetical protein DBW97_03645 [SAR86 cluster bacterium]|tara:strand:- start:1554 stop:1808 length:255 start_codon:yes stop_codon:yes gene_type:complete